MSSDQWIQVGGTVGGIAVALVGALFQHKKQNSTLVTNQKAANHELVEGLALKVTQISDQVSTVKTVVAIHTDEMRIATGKVAILTRDLEKLAGEMTTLSARMERANELYKGVLDRANAKTAPQTEVIETPGGNRLVRNKKE